MDPGYPVIKTLLATHAYRRQNRGYEGLALSLDGQDESPTWGTGGLLSNDTGVRSQILYVSLPDDPPLGPAGK
jgi:hypothetical protein